MNDSKLTSEYCAGSRSERGLGMLKIGFLLGLLSIAANGALAQSAAPTADESLTWHGITLYGIVDVGVQDQSHGAPINDYFVAGSAEVVQKNSNHSVTGVTPSNLSHSRIGLQGNEPIVGDWSGVFKLETYFNPQSGRHQRRIEVTGAEQRPALATQTTNLDSSVCGSDLSAVIRRVQFQDLRHDHVRPPKYGAWRTASPSTTLILPPRLSRLIGMSGTTAGGGDTQNRRLDSSVKYVGSLRRAWRTSSAQYKFNQSTGSANSAFEVSFGGEYAGCSVDVYYTKIKDAVVGGGALQRGAEWTRRVQPAACARTPTRSRPPATA